MDENNFYVATAKGAIEGAALGIAALLVACAVLCLIALFLL